MQLSRFISPLDLGAIGKYLGVVLQLLGVVLVVPALVALSLGEYSFAYLFGALALGSYLFGRLAASSRKPDLELREALVVTALAYLTFGLVGALAFLPAANFIDGFFEAMSGFTTTGLSVLDVESLPQSLIFFRAYAQWIGGAGIIVLSLVVLLGPGRAAFKLYASEFGRENLVGSVIATARVVAVIYLGLTALGFLAFIASGLEPFEAAVHALATLSTGGFSPHRESIGHFGPSVAWAAMGGMLLGAISFPLYYLARREGPRRLLQDLQARYLIVLAAAAALLFLGLEGWRIEALTPSIFHAVSAITTSGFAVSGVSTWPEGSKLLSIFLMIVGGSAGSTAGGIKLFRLILLVRLGGWLVVRSLLPEEAKLPVKYGGLVMSNRELKQIFGFVALYLALVLLTALLLAFAGFGVTDSLFESASALGTVGLSAGVASPQLASWAKLLLIFEMWAGRLEILPVLIVLYPGTWRR